MEIFEEQATESAPFKTKIWKRYVDDTFAILDRDSVDYFLQHLKQSATVHTFHHGDRERQQDRLSRHVGLERTRRPPHHRRLQEANSH